MADSTQAALLVAALQVRNEHADKANTAVRIGDLFTAFINSIYGITGRFNVKAYGATGGNSVLDAAGFAAAAAAAALVGGTVYIPKGTYGDTDWEFTVPSGVTVEGEGDDSVLYRCWVRATGSFGTAIPFTGATSKGDTIIPIPATGLDKSWIRIAGVINCQSPNAGVDQLGTDAAEASFFGEFARIQAGNLATAILDCRLVFPYSNTPGSDSGSFTTTIARVITFNENVRLRRFKVLQPNSTHSEVFRIRFCRNLLIEDVTIDCNDQVAQGVLMEYCLDCSTVDVTTIQKRNSVPTSSSTNGILFATCQNCIGDRCTTLNGYQGVDVTFVTFDTTNRGGPSIACGFANSTARDNERDGFTSHYGCYASFFINCTVHAKLGGIRIRSRGDQIIGCRIFASQAANFGILIDDAAAVDSIVSNNYVEGGAYPILFTHSLAGLLPLETLLKCGSASITNNAIRGAGDHGIYVNDAYTSAVMVGPRIENNDIHFPIGNGIQIGSYNNGTIVRGNRISGILTTKSGIRWSANVKRLHVAENHIYDVNATGFAIQGAGAATFMTDAATFPAGNAEAELFIGTNYTNAATPYQSVIRDTTAYATGYLAGFGATGNLMTAAPVLRGSGTPEGSVYAPVGYLYLRSNGGAGTSVYFKETGTGNTGWVAK
jgi:hypothetical protein